MHLNQLTEKEIKNIIIIQKNIRGWLYRKNQPLNSNKLLLLKSHQDFKPSKTQLEYYIENKASPQILQYVTLQGKTFGEKYMEKIAKEYFNLEKRINSSHDHIKLGKKIEQKSARYGFDGSEWKWQHIEMKHDWDYLLICGLDFKSINFYICPRKTIENLICQQIITGQGKKKEGVAQPQQAYWFSKKDFKKNNKYFSNYFTEIFNERHLIRYLDSF